jgi:hypothetical protein
MARSGREALVLYKTEGMFRKQNDPNSLWFSASLHVGLHLLTYHSIATLFLEQYHIFRCNTPKG